tara:strand:+ start:4758 stop:5480 length:723 start_codon:yes stop_codon:yes gene_type:complete
MRSFKVNGAFHNVYEINESPPVKVIGDWRKGKIGDWIESDDGCIIQILRKGNMLRKNSEVSYIGTCTGTFIADKNTHMDTIKRDNIYSFGGNKTPEEVVQSRDSLTTNEELFVQYISSGMPPEDAYVKAFPTNNKRYARVKSGHLIKTQRVKTAMKEELKPICDELGINETFILKGIKSEAQLAEKSDTRLKAFKMLSDIMDLEDKSAPKVHSATAIQFQGFTKDMLGDVERPKEIKKGK